ncbi:MAG TPA: stage II sporulation protein P [Clostridia bacterium]|nr:stage II sporulation protein P [Clostridia bacterium]
MKRIIKSNFRILIVFLLMAASLGFVMYYGTFVSSSPVWNPLRFAGGGGIDHLTDSYCTVVDEEGSMITKAARVVYKGDEIITGEGKGYRVIKTSKHKAVAEYTGKDKDMLTYRELFANTEIPVITDKTDIGIYHTHSDESYVPTDGTESEPFRGGIYDVGQAFERNLQFKNVNVLYDKTPHEPHDANAYTRSRRTAMNLMKSNPVALIDVHRDGVPDADFYNHEVSGEKVTQLRLVIGNQNPRMSANMDFAKRLMAYTNDVHPGLIKEIFIGKGNYNQDLMPTAILVEAGTHLNTKQRAEGGVALLADTIPVVLGVGEGASNQFAQTSAAGSSGGMKAVGIVLLLLLVGGGGYLVISTGGVEQAIERLRNFPGRELGDLTRAGESDEEADKGKE